MAKGSATRPSTRLSNDVRPSEVRLQLTVDPAVSEAFSGQVEIDLEVRKSINEIVLHAADLEIREAQLVTSSSSIPLRISHKPRQERLYLRAKSALRKGQYTLRISFQGSLRSDLRGLYAANSSEHRFAFSQLEAADARRMFPCFDEPSFKVRFVISITTGSDQSVVSNARIDRIEANSDGTKTVHFTPTPKLSTYLVAIAVGPLVASDAVHAGKTPITVHHAPGSEHLTAFGLRTARECLLALETYFGVPYPYGKLDLLAVPDFEIGAMENAGAVFFRETLLLVDEETATLPEKKRAAEVICHELAHMWFGNLVTMAWWDDLWLNEAFATWMAFAIVDGLHPEWHMWNDFSHGKNAALDLDALRHTHPIYTPVRTPAEATENFDLITYEKGAAVVRMLEHYLGRETFRMGVQTYIRKHRESNAVAADLWRALQEAANQPALGRMVRSWITQPGFPLVRFKVIKSATQQILTMSQEQFLASGPSTRTPAKDSAAKRWLIPWVGKCGGHTERLLLTKRRSKLSLPVNTEFIYGNAGDGGFFRPLHGDEELVAITNHLKQLNSAERLGLISHGFALAYAGYTNLESYLNLIQRFGDEEDPDVLVALSLPLERILSACPSPNSGDALRALCVKTWRKPLDRMGLREVPREEVSTHLLRATRYDLVGRVGRDAVVITDAGQRISAVLGDARSVEANLAAPITVIAAQHGGDDLFERYLQASQREDTPQRRRLFRLSLADFEGKGQIKRLHKLYETPVIPTQDMALVLARQLQNRAAQAATWTFIKRRWPALRKRLTPMLAARLISATSALDSSFAPEVLAFFKQHPIPTAKRALQQLQERFRYAAAFKRSARKALQEL